MAWGVAEALIFPIIPDFYAAAASPASPKRWWRLGLALTLGSAIGGAVGYMYAASFGPPIPLESLPLVSAGMADEASAWVADTGALAVMRQPLSGIPYKVFVYLAGWKASAFRYSCWAASPLGACA